jgi:DNA-binding response OmpR family regulator
VTLIESFTHFLSQSNLAEIDLFLIDISLWDGNWIEIVKSLKQSEITQNIPTIFISWHTEISLKVEWLDAGADDYLMKPFEFEELLARIRSNMRKQYPSFSSSTLTYNNIVFETANRKIYIKWKETTLSKKEKQILEHLMLHQKKCISKSDLQKMFWKGSPKFSVPENTMNVTICNLRKKLWKELLLKTIVWEWYCLQ